MSAEKKQIKVLDDLLKETEHDEPRDYNFEKIMSLIEKTREMKKEEKQRSALREDYFKQLKEKIAESTAYLEKARKDLDNVAEVKVRKIPQINTIEEYEALMQKSDQEIEDDMTTIKLQLASLESRVKKFDQRSLDADAFYNRSMKTLETITKNLSGDH